MSCHVMSCHVMSCIVNTVHAMCWKKQIPNLGTATAVTPRAEVGGLWPSGRGKKVLLWRYNRDTMGFIYIYTYYIYIYYIYNGLQTNMISFQFTRSLVLLKNNCSFSASAFGQFAISLERLHRSFFLLKTRPISGFQIASTGVQKMDSCEATQIG